MHILLVDDDPVTLEVLKATLEHSGYEVSVARNGEEAWHRLGRDPAQVIVSDWSMPRMEGTALCQRIRAHRLGDYIYFILLSAQADKESYRMALGTGVDDFLAKPFRPDDLLLRLRVAERFLSFMKEVRELKMLLPVCSDCHRIRDVEGSWHHIESYRHLQMAADLAQGVCPECRAKQAKHFSAEAQPHSSGGV